MTGTQDSEMELTSPKLIERWQKRVRKSTAEIDGGEKRNTYKTV